MAMAYKQKTSSERRNGAPVVELRNDTVINVARLLQEPVGASRHIKLQVDWFALDTDMMSRDLAGDLRLTRISDGIMLSGTVEGIAMIECVRCLEIYDQPFKAEIEQVYRPLIDIHSGFVVTESYPEEDDGEVEEIDESHELDLAEPLRQFAILALPMQPVCGPDCPGPEIEQEEEDLGDQRFAALAELLEDAKGAGDTGS